MRGRSSTGATIFAAIFSPTPRAHTPECVVNVTAKGEQPPIEWRGLSWTLPFPARVKTGRNRLDFTEVTPECADFEAVAHFSVIPYDQKDHAAFTGQWRSTCDLSADRCWTESVGASSLKCMHSGGVPDPHVEWTPTVSCEVTPERWRVFIRGEDARYYELLEGLRKAIRTRRA
jgi:hypothetical protein